MRTSRASLETNARSKRNKNSRKANEGQCIEIAKEIIMNSTLMRRMVSRILDRQGSISVRKVQTEMKGTEMEETLKTSLGECKMTFDVWKKRQRGDIKNSSITIDSTDGTACTIHSIRRSRTGIQSRG